MLTSVEHEAIHAYLLIPGNTYPLYQLLLIANGGQRRHEPAVAVGALSHVVGGRAFYEESGVFKDVLPL